MKLLRNIHRAGFLVIGCLLLVASVAGLQAYMGDTIPLQGYSYESQTVYLFLTGPNLPANGVALNDITARADQGHFTQVSVDSNDHWVYKWGTNSVGGRLDAGTYTVWVANSPTDRSHLESGDYSTISIGLGNPKISVVTPGVPGTLVLNSTPVDASVVVNDVYRGKTPLTLEGVEPGTYTVTFSHFGYVKFSTPVKVESGKITEATATLMPETGSLAINTSPAGARLMLDGADAGISPVTLTNLATGNHTLTVTSEGYTRQEQVVKVITGQTVPVEVGLARITQVSVTRAAGLFPATLLAGMISVVLVAFYRSRIKE